MVLVAVFTGHLCSEVIPPEVWVLAKTSPVFDTNTELGALETAVRFVDGPVSPSRQIKILPQLEGTWMVLFGSIYIAPTAPGDGIVVKVEAVACQVAHDENLGRLTSGPEWKK